MLTKLRSETIWPVTQWQKWQCGMSHGNQMTKMGYWKKITTTESQMTLVANSEENIPGMKPQDTLVPTGDQE